jgi:hypothetical protein
LSSCKAPTDIFFAAKDDPPKSFVGLIFGGESALGAII